MCSHSSLRLSVVPAVFSGALSLGVAQISRQSADQNEIRKADTAWSHAAETKDLDKFVSFYADDASAFPFNAPVAIGKEQIRQLWSRLMSKPGFGLSFQPTKIEVSKSGDMAYETGTFELKLNGPQGNATRIPGKYVVAWKKQPNREWKAVADIFNTDK
ncbi:MAG: nuclear transport factor 2 family protein [Terriglobales bacterium]